MNRTVGSAVQDLESPSGAIWAVEGLRQARILRDPTGALAALQAKAHAFDWAPLRPAAHDWVSYQVAHAAEEVQKLLGLRGATSEDGAILAPQEVAPRRGDLGGLANATMGLNLTIGYAMAVAHEVLFRSENRWIAQVIEAVGVDSAWSAAFRQSLGLAPAEAHAPIWSQSAGALQLYTETVILLADRLCEADRVVALEAAARIQEEVS